MRLLDRGEFDHQHVEFIVADDGSILDIVMLVILGDELLELVYPFLNLLCFHREICPRTHVRVYGRMHTHIRAPRTKKQI